MNRSWTRYAAPLAILTIQAGLVIWYLVTGWGRTGPGFPYDDGWIHAVFARNLAQYGTIGFHVGEWTGGTSSLLWVLLLALGQWLGLSAPGAAALLGSMAWGISSISFFLLLKTGDTSRKKALAWTLCLLAVGPLTYLALSGMETALFIALSLLAAVAYDRGRYNLVGLSLSLLILTRIEGLALVAAICLAVMIRERLAGITHLLQCCLPSLITLALYAAYNIAVTGHPLPTTMAGRKWLWGFPERALVLTPTYLLSYVRIWYAYISDWLFHARALPLLPRVVYNSFLWGTLLLGLVDLLQRTTAALRARSLPALLVILWWSLAHNLVYLLLAPLPSLRHQVPNLLLLVLLLALGLGKVQTWTATRNKALRAMPLIIALLLGAGLLPSVIDWQRAYADHVSQINEVHVKAGRWINDHTPPDARVAAFDVGAVAYFGQRRTLDLGGLVERDFATLYLYPKRTSVFLKEKEASHLAIIERDAPLTGIGERLELKLSTTDGVQIDPLIRFRFEPEIPFPFDSLPYYYYLPALWQMTIYQIEK